jgi:hypothetical protein
MKKFTQILVSLLLMLNTYGQQYVTFSIEAHADDWQLFMSSQIVPDLDNGAKVVFITFTAGDGGNGVAGSGTVPYYLAREKGSMYASKFASDLTAGTIGANPPSQQVTINGHSIVKYVYRNNIVSYFLRLPDGNGDGNGFASTGNKSLKKLNAGSISSISAVDGTTSYSGWNDLVTTIKAIVILETGSGKQGWIKTPSLDAGFNPGDHSDHLYSSVAAQDAVSNANNLPWIGIAEFIDYHTASLSPNLSNSDYQNAAAFFGLCNWGLIENRYSHSFDDGHKSFVWGDYFRVKRVPAGNSPLAKFLEPELAEYTPVPVMPEKGKEEQGLIYIPMVVSISDTVSRNDRSITMYISLFEPGELSTGIYDLQGKSLAQKNIKMQESGLVKMPISNNMKMPGVYLLKNILNNRYFETRKITIK